MRTAVNVLFRGDGNPAIGLGHVVRCLALADEFRNLGSSPTFAIQSGSVAVEKVKQAGFPVWIVVLAAVYFTGLRTGIGHWGLTTPVRSKTAPVGRFSGARAPDRACMVLQFTATFLRRYSGSRPRRPPKICRFFLFKIHRLYI